MARRTTREFCDNVRQARSGVYRMEASAKKMSNRLSTVTQRERGSELVNTDGVWYATSAVALIWLIKGADGRPSRSTIITDGRRRHCIQRASVKSAGVRCMAAHRLRAHFLHAAFISAVRSRISCPLFSYAIVSRVPCGRQADFRLAPALALKLKSRPMRARARVVSARGHKYKSN